MSRIGIRSFSSNLVAAIRMQGVVALEIDPYLLDAASKRAFEFARENGMEFSFVRIDSTLFTTYASRSDIMHYDNNSDTYNIDIPTQEAARNFLEHFTENGDLERYLKVAEVFLEEMNSPRATDL